jgi:hypothetical protein
MTDREELVRRIATARPGTAFTTAEVGDAARLLADMLAAAEQHGIQLEDFDWTVDLPGACMDVMRAKRRREGQQ